MMKLLREGLLIPLLAWGLLAASPGLCAPFLTSDPAQVDGYEFLIDQGEWVPCQADAGKMKCDIGSLPLGGHLLRGRAVVSGKASDGKVWLYVFKKRWYEMDLYYVLKMDGENISWEVQAIK